MFFASHYQHLVYFGHALEILLHSVVEDDASAIHDEGTPTPPDPDNRPAPDPDPDSESNPKADDDDSPTPPQSPPADGVLQATVAFLDHFDASLDVVVGCARKIEMTRWPRLFDVVGTPKRLFEACLARGRLKTAARYLLVLHNMEQLDGENADAIRLLRAAAVAEDWQLCREVLRFLHSIDDSGVALRGALAQSGIVADADGEPPSPPAPLNGLVEGGL